ncbi:MAG: TRAP transporter small permease [Pseudomonadota bacterium]
MAGSSNVFEDDSTISRLDRALYSLERKLAIVSGLAVFSLMFFAAISVTGRHALNQPLPGYVDWIQQLMPLIAFMGISYAQRDGGHIRMDIVVGALKGRLLWTAEFITAFFMLALLLLLVWGSWAHFERSFDWAAPNWSRDSSIDIGLPLWPAKLLAPIAFSVICVRLLLQLWGYARAFVRNDDAPVAVPLVEDAASQAAREARSVGGE